MNEWPLCQYHSVIFFSWVCWLFPCQFLWAGWQNDSCHAAQLRQGNYWSLLLAEIKPVAISRKNSHQTDMREWFWHAVPLCSGQWGEQFRGVVVAVIWIISSHVTAHGRGGGERDRHQSRGLTVANCAFKRGSPPATIWFENLLCVLCFGTMICQSLCAQNGYARPFSEWKLSFHVIACTHGQ